MTPWVGRALRRVEDPPLVTGRGRYTADTVRGVAAVRFVRSPVARGRIRAIEAPPGAVVFTAADLRGVKPIRPLLHRPDYLVVEQPVLAGGRVNFLGEAVAVAVGADAAEAEDIAEQVHVDIEAENALVDLDPALEPGAPVVHSHASSNVAIDGRLATPGPRRCSLRQRRYSSSSSDPAGRAPCRWKRAVVTPASTHPPAE